MIQFLKRYAQWVLILGLVNVGVWLAFEYRHSRTLGFEHLWPIRMYLLSGLLLFDNLCVLWWYADSTKQLVKNGEDQRQLMEQQLATAKAEFAQAGAQALIAQKPLVFIDRVEDPERKGYYRYAAHNVGGGFAVNVYYFDVTITNPVSIGALAAGEERPLPAGVGDLLREGGAGVRHLIVAEGQYTRTTQWSPTLNFRTQEAGDHKGQVIHRTAHVSVEPPRFQYQSLHDYMRANAQEFRNQLKALADDEVSRA